MPVFHRKPQILSVPEMFLFWVENLKREKPHLICKNFNNRVIGGNNGAAKTPEVWYKAKQELEYLQRRNLVLDEKIIQLEKAEKDLYKFTNATIEIFEFKKEIAHNKIKIAQLAKLPDDTKELIITFKQFKEIISVHNQLASEDIIQGKTLNLNNKLGYVQIRKIVPKEIRRLEGRIDWGESIKYRKELEAQGIRTKNKNNPTGKEWLVYVRQSFYLRWAWMKRYSRACTVKNNRVYVFVPTAPGSGKRGTAALGNKGKLVAAQRANPLLHFKYTVVTFAGKDSTIVLNT